MYNPEVVAVAEDAARGEAMNDRIKYLPFLARAEEFVAENDMIIGGGGATEYLLAKPPGLDSFSMELLSATPANHARSLATALFMVDPNGLGHYTTLMTRNPDEEFAIIINGRELIKIWGTPFHERKNMRLTKMLIPSMCGARFDTKARQLFCMGPEIQLIATYTTLCSPSRVSQWVALIETERALRALMRKEIVSKIERIGASEETPKSGGDANSWHTRRAKLHSELIKMSEANRVLVGKNAIAILSKKTPDASVVQLVSGNKFKTDIDEIHKVATSHGFQMRYSEDNPLIPSDPRLRRTTITIEGVGGKKKDIIAQLYNTAVYDLIPYTTRLGKLKIGSPYAIMRFRHVDMWVIRLLGNIQALATDQVKQLLGAMVDDFDDSDPLIDNAGPDDLFPLSYIGDLEDAEIAQKRTAHHGRKPFVQPIYPVINANKLAKMSEYKKESVSAANDAPANGSSATVKHGGASPATPWAKNNNKLTYAQIVAAQNSSSSKSS